MTGTLLVMVVDTQTLTNLSVQELREMVHGLLTKMAGHDQEIASRELTIAAKDRDILYRQTKIDQLTHEMAVLKRWKFARSREQLDAGQISLLDKTLDADIAAIEEELEQLAPNKNPSTDTPKQPKRAPLPADLPRVEFHHELDATACTTPGCGCTLKRIGEDVSEKLDYTPGLFTVERNATFAANGRVRNARPSRKRPCQHRSSTRASSRSDCWPRCWWPNTPIIYRFIARKASLHVPAWHCLARLWPSGWA
jgi:transposase